MKYEITEIQFFDFPATVGNNFHRWYSANVIINDEFIMQVSSTTGNASIPRSIEACWKNAKKQDAAKNNIDAAELEKILEEKNGFDNSISWLKNSPLTEIM